MAKLRVAVHAARLPRLVVEISFDRVAEFAAIELQYRRKFVAHDCTPPTMSCRRRKDREKRSRAATVVQFMRTAISR